MMPPILPDMKVLVLLAALGVVLFGFNLIWLFVWLFNHVSFSWS